MRETEACVGEKKKRFIKMDARISYLVTEYKLVPPGHGLILGYHGSYSILHKIIDRLSMKDSIIDRFFF